MTLAGDFARPSRQETVRRWRQIFCAKNYAHHRSRLRRSVSVSTGSLRSSRGNKAPCSVSKFLEPPHVGRYNRTMKTTTHEALAHGIAPAFRSEQHTAA